MKFFFIILFALGLNTSYSQSEQSVEEIFIKTFYTSYSPAYCHDNISSLFRKAKAAGISIEEFQDVYISEPWGPEQKRIEANYQRTTVQENTDAPAPAMGSWKYHVVAFSSTDPLKTIVYDFDFGNVPRPMPLRAYIDKMFLNDQDGKPLPEEQYNHKLSNYQVIVCPAAIRINQTGYQWPGYCQRTFLKDWVKE